MKLLENAGEIYKLLKDDKLYRRVIFYYNKPHVHFNTNNHGRNKKTNAARDYKPRHSWAKQFPC